MPNKVISFCKECGRAVKLEYLSKTNPALKAMPLSKEEKKAIIKGQNPFEGIQYYNTKTGKFQKEPPNDLF